MSQASPVSNGRYGPIEVFRAGTFTPMTGAPQTIDEKSLRQIADTYDAQAAPAPVVVGHPSIDAPAYGWVEHLYTEGGILKAVIKDTEPAFAEQVRAGRYRKVSISLFLPSAAANPKPGTLYLKHVGFLGGTAPAVPGLKPVSFAATGDSLPLTQDFAGASAEYALSHELREMRASLNHQRAEIEVEKLIEAGRVLPVFKDEVLAFAAGLSNADTVSFSDGSTKPRRDWFFDYLSRQPQVVSFGAVDIGAGPGKPGSAGLARIPDGYTVDRSNVDVHDHASQIARTKGISYAAALDHVMDGRE